MDTMAAAVDWERYEAWNQGIAEVVYPPSAAGRPAYLDLEEDVLAAIKNIVEPEVPDARTALVAVVIATLNFQYGPSRLLHQHLSRLDSWYREFDHWNDVSDVTPPPVLALLSVFSLAAEEMHEGEGMAANNYYGRLREVLGLTETQLNTLRNSYRRLWNNNPASLELWGALNFWLEILEGTRGLPTAYTSDGEFAHVGLPLSQALVREADRKKFYEMFSVYGLPPRSVLSVADMVNNIDEWASQIPCPLSNSLERIWKRSRATRWRIAEVACQVLKTWEGSDGTLNRNSVYRPNDNLKINAMLRNFPKTSLSLNLVIPVVELADTFLQFQTIDGRTVQLVFVNASSSWSALADPSILDFGAFLSCEINMLDYEDNSFYKRRPKRIVPLRRDDLLQSYVETERLQMGESSMLIVDERIADKVTDFLRHIARPGFRSFKSDQLYGLPEGWLLFAEVQILSSVPIGALKGKLIDLNVLQPMSTGSANLEGGLKLPGNISKWSSYSPPEIRASFDNALSIEAKIVCNRALVDLKPQPQHIRVDGSVLIWNLADLDLSDGDYRVKIQSQGEEQKEELTVRLRTADNPSVQVKGESSLPIHDTNAPGFALLTSQGTEGFQCVPDEPAISLPSNTDPLVVGWYEERKQDLTEPPTAVTPIAPATSEHQCLLKGAHHMMIEQEFRGMDSVEGVCKYCGFTKRYPTRKGLRKGYLKRDKLKRQTPIRYSVSPEFAVSSLPTIRSERVNWQVAFDAVCHVGSGNVSSLERIANATEVSGPFASDFIRRLSALGHIEVSIDPRTMKPKTWAVNSPVLVGIENGDYALVGFRSSKMLAALKESTDVVDSELIIRSNIVGPPLIIIKQSDDEGLGLMRAELGAVTKQIVRIVKDGSRQLLAKLPPLSKALEGLTKQPLPGSGRFEHWDPNLARFKSVDYMSEPGAYRISDFRRVYLFRQPSGLGDNTALIGDAYIVKYAAALAVERPLAGYDETSKVLYTPIGANLPGLYERAAVFATGCPPEENYDERIIQYNNVPSDVAGHILKLLMS